MSKLQHFDPWETADGDDWVPMPKNFAHIASRNNLNTYINEWTPAATADSSWVGNKHLACAMWDLCSEIKAQLLMSGLPHLDVRICGGAARDYVFNVSEPPKDIDIFVTGLSEEKTEINLAGGSVLAAINALRGASLQEKSAIKEIGSDSDITVSCNAPFTVRFNITSLDGTVTSVEVMGFSGPLRDILEDSDWEETSFAIGICKLPKTGTVTVQTPHSLSDIVCSTKLGFNNLGIRDPSRTLERGLRNAKRLRKSMDYGDLVEIFAMIGLSYDEPLELISP